MEILIAVLLGVLCAVILGFIIAKAPFIDEGIKQIANYVIGVGLLIWLVYKLLPLVGM